MAKVLSAAAQRVQDALKAMGVTSQVVELPESTRSAAEAAQAIGCRVEQIVKSLVFRGQSTNRPILAVVSGGNRVDEEKLAVLVAEPVAKADAEYVRQRTGYAIGVYHPSDMWSRWCAWSTRTCCSTSRFGPRPGRRAPCSG